MRKCFVKHASISSGAAQIEKECKQIDRDQKDRDQQRMTPAA